MLKYILILLLVGIIALSSTIQPVESSGEASSMGVISLVSSASSGSPSVQDEIKPIENPNPIQDCNVQRMQEFHNAYDDQLDFTGDSMLPCIEEVQILYIKKVPFTWLEIGDVVVWNVAYPEGKNYYVHRIVRKKGNTFITKGDYYALYNESKHEDEVPVTAWNYYGLVIGVRNETRPT